MACPSCRATMHSLGTVLGTIGPTWWCPRCGTLKTTALDGEYQDAQAPSLVERCRTLLDIGTEPALYWRLGIAESVGREPKGG